ncbi:MAG: enoyl-CoA hydratase/isomerase family protein [Promethearchaeota archaeon]
MENPQNSANDTSKEDQSVDTVLFDIKDKIATITINRPEKRNALRMEEFEKLIEFIQAADSDSNVHVIRIRSSGDRAFSAGLDLNMLQELSTEREEVEKLLQLSENTVRTFLKSKKPIVNQVQGPAVAWGTILCLAADFVIAGDNPRTFFNLPEIDLGMFPASGALTMALLKTGFAAAKKILMIPERIPLERAEQLGIVSKRCSLDSLEQITIEFCKNLASKSQSILYLIKSLVNNFQFGDFDSYIDKEGKALEFAMYGDSTKIDEFIKKMWNTI